MNQRQRGEYPGTPPRYPPRELNTAVKSTSSLELHSLYRLCLVAEAIDMAAGGADYQYSNHSPSYTRHFHAASEIRPSDPLAVEAMG